MSSLLGNIKLTFSELVAYLVENPDTELPTFIFLGILLLIFLLLQRKSGFRIDILDYAKEKYFLFLNDLVFPLLYLVVVLYIAPRFLEGKISLIFYNSIAYFYISYYVIKYLIKIRTFDFIPWGITLYILTVFSVLDHLIINLNDRFSGSSETYDFFLLLLKICLIFVFYIAIFRGIKFLLSLIPEALKLTRRIFENILPILLVLFLSISALWLLNIISFSSQIFTGLILSTFIILVYAFLRAYSASYYISKIFDHRETYEDLLNSIRLSLTLLLVYGLYNIFINFFNFDYLINFAESLYILKTDLVKISFFSALSSIYLFLILFSLIGVVKNLTFLSYIGQGNDIAAGSIRAIISNLGLLLIFIISLSQLGLDWKVLLPFAGALGIGLGFGLQTIMNNYISGFILLFSKKLKVGDVIEIEGNAGRAIGSTLETIYGRVKSIDVLSTVVQTTDNIEIVIPNSQFIEGQIVNYSLSDSDIRLRIPFGVSYASDPNQIKEILLKVGKDNPQLLNNPAPNVWFTEMGDSAIVFNLLCWVDIRMLWRISPIVSEIYFKGWYELKEAGIEIPFPQRDLWLKNKINVVIEK